MASTKKPKGLKIARNGGTKFTVSWNHGQKKYTDQELIWYEVYKKTSDKNKKKRYEKAHKVALTKSDTKKRISFSYSDYPPTEQKRLCSIKVKVRAKSKSGWSGWTGRVTYDIDPPKAPTFNADKKPAPLVNANTAQYSWNVYDDGKKKIYHWSHYQVVEVPNFSGTNLDEVSWSKQKIVKEDYLPYSQIDHYNTVDVPVSILPSGDGNTTQFFRVRTYGPNGFSKWAYNWHIFGMGNLPRCTTINAIKADGGYRVSVDWSLATEGKYKNPSDQVVVRHAVTVPIVTKDPNQAGGAFIISCPDNLSSGWTDHSATFDTSGRDRLVFQTDSIPGNDEVMFVQVMNQHDTSDTTRYSKIEPVTIDGFYGTLADPILKKADYNPDTKRVEIEIDRQTTVVNSFCAVYIARRGASQDSCIGILPSNPPTSTKTFSVPDDISSSEDISFYVVNMVANYSVGGGYKIHQIMMSSNKVYSGGAIPRAPVVELTTLEPGTILVGWDWPWTEAQSAELSWSLDKYAWESTNAPTTYVISNSHAGRWRIAGLDYGRYYVRVRLIKSGDNYETYGQYSSADNYIDLTADVPPVPSLEVVPSVIAAGGEINCYWQYAAEDGSTQLQANLYEAFVDSEGNVTYSKDPLSYVSSGQHIVLDTTNLDWTPENSPRYLCIETLSSYGTSSGKSELVTVRIADPLNVSLTLGDGFTSETDEDGTVENTLTRFPFTVSVSGIDQEGTTSMYIRRLTPYLIERPDGDDIQGYQNEAVFVAELDDTGSIMIEANDQRIIGSFDDGGNYEIVLRAVDQYGQLSEPDPTPFVVDWDHKASIPSAEIDIDYYDFVAFIKPQAFPSMDFFISSDHVYVEAEEVDEEDIGLMEFTFNENGHLLYTSENAFADFELLNGDLVVSTDGTSSVIGDVCDIYRLTADKPELVYEGAQFGTTYVDPYPTLGTNGGYRIAYRTKYNDFMDVAGVPAWVDYGYYDMATLNTFDTIIDFDGNQIHLPFNLDISHKWEKDFTETKYLGGAIQGDWNPAVSHTLSINTDVAVEYYSETAQLMRQLAAYPGVCHIRTPDGSSFAANIDVSEDRGDKMIRQLAKFSLDITRVDQETPDGMTYEEWIGE